MINDVNVWTQGRWIQRSGGPGHPGVAAEQTEERRRKFTHLPTQLPPSHALWQPSQHRRLPPPRHRWASVQIVDRWCVCNSSNTLPALEKLASNVPSAWPSSFSVASRWFPLVVSTWRGGFVIFSGTMRWSSLSRTTCGFFWPKRSFQCDMRALSHRFYTSFWGFRLQSESVGNETKSSACLSLGLFCLSRLGVRQILPGVGAGRTVRGPERMLPGRTQRTLGQVNETHLVPLFTKPLRATWQSSSLRLKMRSRLI